MKLVVDACCSRVVVIVTHVDNSGYKEALAAGQFRLSLPFENGFPSKDGMRLSFHNGTLSVTGNFSNSRFSTEKLLTAPLPFVDECFGPVRAGALSTRQTWNISYREPSAREVQNSGLVDSDDSDYDNYDDYDEYEEEVEARRRDDARFDFLGRGGGCSPAFRELRDLCQQENDNNVAALRALLQRTPHLTKVGDDERLTLLHFAAMSGNARCITVLIAARADVKQVDEDGTNAMGFALRCAPVRLRAATVQILLDNGALPPAGPPAKIVGIDEATVGVLTAFLLARAQETTKVCAATMHNVCHAAAVGAGGAAAGHGGAGPGDSSVSAVSLKRCSACRRVAYHSAACQKSDWKFHKHNCFPIDASISPSPVQAGGIDAAASSV